MKSSSTTALGLLFLLNGLVSAGIIIIEKSFLPNFMLWFFIFTSSSWFVLGMWFILKDEMGE